MTSNEYWISKRCMEIRCRPNDRRYLTTISCNKVTNTPLANAVKGMQFCVLRVGASVNIQLCLSAVIFTVFVAVATLYIDCLLSEYFFFTTDGYIICDAENLNEECRFFTYL